MLPSGHLQKDNKGTTGGQEEDNGRTTEGQCPDTALGAARPETVASFLFPKKEPQE